MVPAASDGMKDQWLARNERGGCASGDVTPNSLSTVALTPRYRSATPSPRRIINSNLIHRIKLGTGCLPMIRHATNSRRLLLCALATLWFSAPPPGLKAEEAAIEVDTALIVSVDVSSSVDNARYVLQMEGIAAALEDKGVLDAVLGGPRGGILISLITWADHAKLVVPWTTVSNAEEASALAKKIRSIPQQTGEFTCMARMFRYTADKVVLRIPTKASKIVIDVSGDGPDNCNSGQLLETTRNELAAGGITINGLPILEGQDAATIEGWYKDNVKAGPGGFIVPAKGYADFARAFRQKFVVEISQNFPRK